MCTMLKFSAYIPVLLLLFLLPGSVKSQRTWVYMTEESSPLKHSLTDVANRLVLEFRVCGDTNSGAVLMFAEKNDTYFLVGVKDARVIVQWGSLGPKPFNVQLYIGKRRSIEPRKTYVVELLQLSSSVFTSSSINNKTVPVTSAETAVLSSKSLPDGFVYFGHYGTATILEKFRYIFPGTQPVCLGSITIGTKLLDFSRSSAVPCPAELCGCQPGFQGTFCEIEINECWEPVSHQCQNGATCVDEINSYSCTCPPQWTGIFCETVREFEPWCKGIPCLHNSTCIEEENGFRCSCSVGFTGRLCEADIDECSHLPSPCKNYVSCENTLGSFICHCMQGFSGPSCEDDINYCLSVPCQFGGTCIDGLDGYRCICLDEFTGDNCEGVLQGCGDNSPCSIHSVCIQQSTGQIQCFCDDGYYGIYCEHEINECASTPCYNGGTCFDGVATFYCMCPPGYTSRDCSVDVDECYSEPCMNGGMCIESAINEFQCLCPTGFTGSTCETNVNDCLPDPCNVTHSKCVDVIAGYRCVCPDGFTGSSCNTLIDYCLDVKPCLNGGSCFGGRGSYVCRCPYPYVGDICEANIDPCYNVNCENGGTCVNDPQEDGGFRCYCAPGFIGERCDADVYDCLSTPCQNNGTCIEGTGGHIYCACTEFYDGSFCEARKTNCTSNPCFNDAHCMAIDTFPGFKCVCEAGWEGQTCNIDVNECAVHPGLCQNEGHCVNRFGTYACLCSPYWTGQHCEVDVIECTETSCVHGTCVEQEGDDYLCDCFAGYTGMDCETQIQACEKSPCLNNGTCIDQNESYVCACSSLYTGDHCGELVSKGDACASSPCLHGKCVADRYGEDYICICDQGYTGIKCDEIPAGTTTVMTSTTKRVTNSVLCAALNFCNNIGTCIMSDVGVPSCICPNNFQGIDCSEPVLIPDNDCVKSNPCASNVTGICIKSSIGQISCQCVPGYSGAACDEVLSVTFTGKEYLEIPVSPNEGDGLVVQFGFSTTVKDGLLFLLTGNSAAERMPLFVALELHNAETLRFLLVDQMQDVESNFIVQKNGAENHIILSVQQTYISLTVNPDSCDFTERCFLSVPLNTGIRYVFDDSFLIGGAKSLDGHTRSHLLSNDGFIGCLQFISLQNDDALDLSQFASAKSLIAACAVRKVCSSDSCLNGGTCKDLWTKVECHCISGYSGNRCQHLTTVSFEDSSYLHIPHSASTDGKETIKEMVLTISTPVNSGIILYTLGAGSQLAVYLRDNNIYIVVLVLDDVIEIKVEEYELDSKWHSIQLKISDDLLIARIVDQAGRVRARSVGMSSTPVSIGYPVLFGTLHSAATADMWRLRLPFSHGFAGCLKDVYFNSLLIDLLMSVPYFEKNLDPPAAIPGCAVDELCAANPCRNGGQCAGTWQGVKCMCSSDFTGNLCEKAQALTFNGRTDFVRITINPGEVSFGSSGSIDFRTRDHDSTFYDLEVHRAIDVYSMTLDYIMLYGIVNGIVTIMTHNLGAPETGEKFVSFSRNYSDGAWHKLTWNVEERRLLAMIDSNETVSIEDAFDPTTAVQVYIHLGARLDTFDPSIYRGSRDYSDFFTGCLRDARLDSKYLPLLDHSVRGTGIVVRASAKTGCSGQPLCEVSPCSRNAVCTDLWNSYTCKCLPGWHGPDCTLSVDDCAGFPCQHNGTCVDEVQNFTCACILGYTGRYCESVTHRCEENPCVVNQTSSCTSLFPLDYECTCLPGFVGKNCEEESDECRSNPCQNGGQCVDIINGYYCACPQDYLGSFCEFRHPCASEPCQHNGTCHSTEDVPVGFACQCHLGWTGKYCDQYDYCSNVTCRNGGTCFRSEIGFECSCRLGFIGTDCGMVDYCVDVDCQNEANCVSDMDGFTCLCSQHYTGRFCETPIDKCHSDPCHNGGSCWNNKTMETFYCECFSGWTGELCEKDVHECGSNPCLHGGTCHDSHQSEYFFPGYECHCDVGYFGNNCESETDECANEPCSASSTCVDMQDDYTCICASGFSGRHCELDVRGCSSEPCFNEANCRESATGEYYCICVDGFTGRNCETNIDDCLNNNCKFGRCLDGIEDYSCICNPGYGGLYCEFVNDTCFSNPCKHEGICRYIGRCSCHDIVSACGWYDEECQLENCRHREDCSVRDRSFECECTETGYSGISCEKDINECLQSKTCHHGTCINTVGSYLCNCSGTGYRGRHCQNDINECRDLSDPCGANGVCINTQGSYTCHCRLRFTGSNCDVLVDLCSPEVQPCKNGGLCLKESDTGDIYCDCSSTGFGGVTCEDVINECESETHECRNEAQCVKHSIGYSCLCSEGYTGKFCESQTATADPLREKPSRALVIALPFLFVLICLVVIVLWLIWYLRRSRKMKGKYNPSITEQSHGMPPLPMTVLNPKNDERLV